MKRERVERMALRLDRDARRHGASGADAAALVAAFRLAMPPRMSRFDDDHHPDVLHTARTALILLEDANVVDRDTLCAAAVCETWDPSLAPARVAVEDALGSGVAALLDAVPVPAWSGDRLLEDLLAAPQAAALVALAERLDHARHLHLRDGSDWHAYHALTRDIYVPVAERHNAPLAARIGWWCATFERRFLASA